MSIKKKNQLYLLLCVLISLSFAVPVASIITTHSISYVSYKDIKLANLYSQHSQIVYNTEQLANHGSIQDLLIGPDGLITSTSADSWFFIPLAGQPVNQICVEIAEMQQSGIKSQVYFANKKGDFLEQNSISVFVTTGKNYFTFPEVCTTALRLDIMDQPGTMKITEVQLNYGPTKQILQSATVLRNSVLIAFVLFLVCCSMWFVQVRERLHSMYLILLELADRMLLLLKKHKYAFYGTVTIFLVCFGYEITNFTLSIDEELYLLSPKDPSVWIPSGRFGITLLKDVLMASGIYPPFVSTALSALLWTCSAFVWTVIIDKYLMRGKLTSSMLFIFCGFYISMPSVIAEFMMFNTYNVEVSCAMLLSTVGMYCLVSSLENTNTISYVLAIILIALSFGVYQSFITVFITGVCAFCMLAILTGSIDSCKKWFSYVACFIQSLLVSFALFFTMDLLFKKLTPYNEGLATYTNGFIGWSSGRSFPEVWNDVANNISYRFFNPDMVGSWEFMVCLTIFLLLVIVLIIIMKGWKKFGVLLSGIGLVLSPFLLTLLLGSSNMPFRSMQAIPLSMAVMWLAIIYTVGNIPKMKIGYGALCVMLVVTIFTQAQTLSRLFYGDHVRYEMDKNIAHMIMEDVIVKFGGVPTKPISFLGSYQHRYNASVIPVEVLGGSFWNWDGGASGRMIGFLRACGYDVRSSNMPKAEAENIYRMQLEVWPAQNSILETEHDILIRLS